ncbi:succinate-CoA ligase, beta subunit, putative [Pediculus humanus corporis]|uniref:Succinate-CoA ligase subunit beta n=1 Tax=Pediculus humanus subsp. corporis TaxID=121224 RepID=E0VF18_PEDHC|nr:succinate-CoA ligase, beta subunit, putative [Pediculus humanus corporis]EEB11992.1 succinate-CoA ligase, beta subunit, putative [Pediculus humanus corporis]
MLVSNHDEADKVAKDLRVEEYVVKAQILAGGRGVGVFSNGFKGGVHLTKNPSEVGNLVKQMLGNKLITKQTPKDGILVNKVMVAESVDIQKETYFSILMDRTHNGPVVVVSAEGGVDIENVAEKNPEAIKIIPIDIFKGLTDDIAVQAAEFLKFTGVSKEKAVSEMKKLWKFFLDVDATQVEINPLAESSKNDVVAVDAKINFDDNAQYRQKDIFEMENKTEIDPRELLASQFNLNYIPLEGNIGCLVNGAGLAMATMDIIKLEGGEPANFLDVGGNVNENQVTEAFKLLTYDNKVKAILVNVFGGIVNCATIAKGIVAACKKINVKTPIVVRLEGTNVNEAKKILENSGLPIINAKGLQEAAREVVAAAKR